MTLGGFEVGARRVEFAAVDLDKGADDEQRVGEARRDAAERGSAQPFGLVPVTARVQRLDQIRDEHGAVDPVPAHRLESRLPQSRRLSQPSQHRQRVGEVDVHAVEAPVIADVLGALQGLAKLGDTLLGPADVGEVDATHGQRSDLCLACADTPSERERLLGGRQRLLIAPGEHQAPRE